MSILSSTRSGFYSRLTKEYLLSHGYVQNEMSKIKSVFFYKGHVGSAYVIETFEQKGELKYLHISRWRNSTSTRIRVHKQHKGSQRCRTNVGIKRN